MKKIITVIMAIVMICVMAGCSEVHSHTTTTSYGFDNYGNRYKIVNEYVDGVLVNTEETLF